MTASRGRPTILFAQELGGGFGHVTNLIAVARHFPQARRAFALPDLPLTGELVAARLGRDVALMQSPLVDARPCDFPGPDRTLAQVLKRSGLADGSGVLAAVGRWRALLEALAPDLVVADYAPTLRVAAAGCVPHLVVSNGFSVPPDEAPVPPFRLPDAADEHPEAEETILRAANAARRLLRLPAFPRFTSLLHGDETFVTSFPEIDPFGGRRSRPSTDPVNVPFLPIGPALGDRTGPHVFCYLDAGQPATNPILTALNGLPRPSRVFVRGIDARVLAPHCAPHVEICTALPDQAAILPGSRLVVQPGTQGTSAAALLAGTPQLLVPHSLEGVLTARLLVELGVATALDVSRHADPAQLRSWLEGMLDDPAWGERARAVAGGMQGRRVPEPERPVVEACRALLGPALS